MSARACVAVVALGWVTAPTTANAYECVQRWHNYSGGLFQCSATPCEYLSGSAHTVHMDTSAGHYDDPADQPALQEAAAAWSGHVGADWTFTVSATSTHRMDNDRSESYYVRSDTTEWRDLGLHRDEWDGLFEADNPNETRSAVVIHHYSRWPSCGEVRERDILILDHADGGAVAGDLLRLVLVHELGHVLGFGHEDDIPGVMASNGTDMAQAGGVLGRGGVLTPSEHDLFGLRSEFAGTTTGTNIALSGSYWTTKQPASDDDAPYEFLTVLGFGLPVAPVAPGDCIDSSAETEIDVRNVTFTPLVALNLGTTALTDVPVRVFAVPEASFGAPGPFDHCTDYSGARLVLERHLFLGNLAPYRFARDLCLPPDLPDGWYGLCAEVDPDDTLSETDEGDNLIISQPEHFEVESP